MTTATFLVACRFDSMASATMGGLTAAAAGAVGPAQAVLAAVGDLDVRGQATGRSLWGKATRSETSPAGRVGCRD
jgi:hypothetical protein